MDDARVVGLPAFSAFSLFSRDHLTRVLALLQRVPFGENWSQKRLFDLFEKLPEILLF